MVVYYKGAKFPSGIENRGLRASVVNPLKDEQLRASFMQGASYSDRSKLMFDLGIYLAFSPECLVDADTLTADDLDKVMYAYNRVVDGLKAPQITVGEFLLAELRRIVRDNNHRASAVSGRNSKLPTDRETTSSDPKSGGLSSGVIRICPTEGET